MDRAVETHIDALLAARGFPLTHGAAGPRE